MVQRIVTVRSGSSWEAMITTTVSKYIHSRSTPPHHMSINHHHKLDPSCSPHQPPLNQNPPITQNEPPRPHPPLHPNRQTQHRTQRPLPRPLLPRNPNLRHHLNNLETPLYFRSRRSLRNPPPHPSHRPRFSRLLLCPRCPPWPHPPHPRNHLPRRRGL